MHPGFDPNTLFNDVGVVILSKPVRGVTPGLLPPENLLDQMQAVGTLQGQTFVNHSSTHRSRFCAITTGARFAGACATDDHFTNTSGNFASAEKEKTARKV